jgi:hypothetical protein
VIRQSLEHASTITSGKQSENLGDVLGCKIEKRVGDLIRVEALEKLLELLWRLVDERLEFRPEQRSETHERHRTPRVLRRR